PQALKAELGTASILKGSRVVFNVGGNRYRVIMAINYQRQLGFIRFVGTHAQYDQINAETV
ncbi:type II toxin-antitoxin system HigB family toxin, partial [Salmonella enterica]